MRDGTIGSRCTKLAKGAMLGALLWAAPALAQETAPPAGAPPAEAPATPPPPPAAPPPVVEAKPAEAAPAPKAEVLPPIDVGAWIRTGALFQGSNPSKLNDWHMSSAYVELHAGGKITKEFSVTLNLNADMANYGTTAGPVAAQVEDAIIQYDPMDELHVWAGHLLVMVDRDNSSGPFFMIPWNYPGFFAGVAAPAEGPFGRNNGVNVWGDIAGGRVSYFAGAYDNGNVATSPLYSGRVRISLFDKETGFWGNGTYFGDKDILSFDVGGQFQKHGSSTMLGGDKDYADVNVDGLFEKKLGAPGSYISANAAYYHYNVLDGGISNFYYGLLAYATPVVGIGNIQPMVRYQGETIKGNTGTNPWNVDAAVSYLIKGPALRLNATYSHTKLTSDTSANSIGLNAQAIFF